MTINYSRLSSWPTPNGLLQITHRAEIALTFVYIYIYIYIYYRNGCTFIICALQFLGDVTLLKHVK